MMTLQRNTARVNNKHNLDARRRRAQLAKEVNAVTSFMLSVNMSLLGIGACAVLAGLTYGARTLDVLMCGAVLVLAFLLASAPIVAVKRVSSSIEATCAKHARNE